MLIANPIYDSVFKYLMEDERVARRLLSIIMGEEIIEIETRSQEQTFHSQTSLLTVFRLDFVAVILTKTGERKKIIIELQKAKQPIDILRFRRYLGKQYMQQEMVNGVLTDLPLLVIYFLGFKLDVQHSVLKVNRVYHDAVSGAIIEKKDGFIEKLTHNCIVVQIPCLPPKAQNKLEKVLSVFNQKWVKDEDNNWIMNFPGSNDDEDLNLIVERLHTAAEDEEVQELIEAEEEFERSIERFVREKEMVIELKDQVIEQKDQQLEQKDQQIEQKDQVIEQKDQQIEDLKRMLEKALSNK
ncbi:MAG: hypothetical protein AAB316_21240 [Bacteroidota bacterium]